MSEGSVIDLAREAIMAAALMSAPLLITALVVGLVVGLLQALTSVQEMTLTFVPKIAAMLLVFFLSAGFMAGVCLRLFENSVLPLIG